MPPPLTCILYARAEAQRVSMLIGDVHTITGSGNMFLHGRNLNTATQEWLFNGLVQRIAMERGEMLEWRPGVEK